jgi:hypothetical protein
MTNFEMTGWSEEKDATTRVGVAAWNTAIKFNVTVNVAAASKRCLQFGRDPPLTFNRCSSASLECERSVYSMTSSHV